MSSGDGCNSSGKRCSGRRSPCCSHLGAGARPFALCVGPDARLFFQSYWSTSWARVGLPRWASALLLLAISTCLIVIALIFVVPILVQQAAGLIEAAPRKIGRLRAFIEESAREHFGGRYPQAEGDHQDGIGVRSVGPCRPCWLRSRRASGTRGLRRFNFISVLLVTPIVFFYALIDWPKMVAKLDSWSATRQCRPDTCASHRNRQLACRPSFVAKAPFA